MKSFQDHHRDAKPTGRRGSADFTGRARLINPEPVYRAIEWSPSQKKPLIDSSKNAGEIPKQWSAQVVYQAYDAPERTWNGWFTEDDTEYSVERRARTSLEIVGAWRRRSHFRSEEGLRLVMTNRQKEITMRYSSGPDREIKEMRISESDTIRVILMRLKAKGNMHLTDEAGRLFQMEDCPFGYVSIPADPPLQLLHGSALKGKPRDPTPRVDRRIAVEVTFGKDRKLVFIRGAHRSYVAILENAVESWGVTDPCRIESVRAEDDRILVNIELGEDQHWLTEKACPPLALVDDRIHAESTGTGGWGNAVIPQTHPMVTRGAKTAAKPKTPEKIKDALLHNLETDEIETIGRASNYDEALEIARKSGKAPKPLNVAISDANEERILVICKRGQIVSGDGVVSAVTPKKPKAKKTTVLPEKLVGRPVNPDAAFAVRGPAPAVPGVLNQPIEPAMFKTCRVRPLDPAVGFWDIRVEILKEQTRHIRIRKDATGTEILAQTFMDIDVAEDERIKFVLKPLKMEDKALFKVERIAVMAHLALTIHLWDGSQRRCGIEVSPTATRAEIVEKAQYKIDDEPLEDEDAYVILHHGNPAGQPWIQKEYELRPSGKIAGSATVQSRFGTMTVQIPLMQKNRWETIIRNSLPEMPAAVIEEKPLEFRAYYLDEEVTCHVKFVTDDAGEEHLVDLLPAWHAQMFEINQAFGREMIPDTSEPAENNVVFVKSKDGAPPDPQFERLMKYTLGDGSEEFSVRVKNGQTTRDLKEGLKGLHPGINPAALLWEGSALDDADAVNEWTTTTGTSPLRIQAVLNEPVQRFKLWLLSGTYDSGEVNMSGMTKKEVWPILQSRNMILGRINDYKLFVKQDEVQWSDLPGPDVTIVPSEIPVMDR
jgi:hypothetical protein